MEHKKKGLPANWGRRGHRQRAPLPKGIEHCSRGTSGARVAEKLEVRNAPKIPPKKYGCGQWMVWVRSMDAEMGEKNLAGNSQNAGAKYAPKVQCMFVLARKKKYAPNMQYELTFIPGMCVVPTSEYQVAAAGMGKKLKEKPVSYKYMSGGLLP